MTTDPVPQRLSDADRDEAAAMLREHFEAGRLDETEFADRLGSALAARFTADFAPLFSDLPEPRPDARGGGTGGAAGVSPAPPARWTPPPTRSTGDLEPAASGPHLPPQVAQWVPLARGLIWPICILSAIVVGNWFVFIAIAIVGSIVLNHLAPEKRQPPPQIGG